MHEPTPITLDGKTYLRWDTRVWTCDGSDHLYGLRQKIDDPALVAQLEKSYAERQSQHAPRSPRAPMARFPAGNAPTVRSKGRTKGREWKGEAKS